VTLLFAVAIRSSIVLLAALAVYLLLRRRSAAMRHRVLAAGIVASAIVVPLVLVAPSWVVPVPQPAAVVFETGPDAVQVLPSVESPRTPASTAEAVARFVPIVWGAGVAAGALLLVVGLARLAWITARAVPLVTGPWPGLVEDVTARYGIRRPVRLLRTDRHDTIATWGVFRPRVLLPVEAEDWSEEWARVVLSHELAHVRRGDWAVQILAEVLRALLWCNPLIWLSCARLRRESEYACDDAVLRTGLPPTTYAARLLDIARACRPPVRLPALPIARPSTLEGRVAAMLNTTLDRRTPSRRATALVLVALLGVALAAASLRMAAQAGPSTLTGHVYDPSGAVLPAAEVVLEDAQQVKWPTTTDASGRFEFAPVGAGSYVLHVSLPGFRTLRHEFELRDAGSWNQAITLQVGELEETITVTARRPTSAPAPGAGEPVRIGGNIRPPRKLVDRHPVYPAAMRDAGLEGLVPMEATIAQDGTVSSVRVLSAQVHPEFARAAEEAVRQWRFSQTLLNGVPVDVRMAVSVRFSLTD
jgi:TonB family protein